MARLKAWHAASKALQWTTAQELDVTNSAQSTFLTKVCGSVYCEVSPSALTIVQPPSVHRGRPARQWVLSDLPFIPLLENFTCDSSQRLLVLIKREYVHLYLLVKFCLSWFCTSEKSIMPGTSIFFHPRLDSRTLTLLNRSSHSTTIFIPARTTFATLTEFNGTYTGRWLRCYSQPLRATGTLNTASIYLSCGYGTGGLALFFSCVFSCSTDTSEIKFLPTFRMYMAALLNRPKLTALPS
jgi:hypothetical protein